MHASCEAFYIRKWPNQEHVSGQTICLNLSFEKHGHLAMSPCQSLKARKWQASGHHSCSKVACPLCLTLVAHLPPLHLREGPAGGAVCGAQGLVCVQLPTPVPRRSVTSVLSLGVCHVSAAPCGHASRDLGHMVSHGEAILQWHSTSPSQVALSHRSPVWSGHFMQDRGSWALKETGGAAGATRAGSRFPAQRQSTVVPDLLGTRDWLCGRRFFRRLGMGFRDDSRVCDIDLSQMQSTVGFVFP